ncbi:MAG: hypothetical protein IJT87_01150 [Ruminiclostridium sp.]|nr:hypothetical protein [Ruminiclostridium sp.]
MEDERVHLRTIAILLFIFSLLPLVGTLIYSIYSSIIGVSLFYGEYTGIDGFVWVWVTCFVEYGIIYVIACILLVVSIILLFGTRRNKKKRGMDQWGGKERH